MKKSSIPLFIAAFLFPYVILAFVYSFFRYGFALDYFLITMQSISVVINCFCVKKIIPYIVLSVNLCACTVAANIIQVKLYMQYVSADSETALVGELETIIGGLLTVGLSVLVYFLIGRFKNAINYEQRVNNSVIQPIENKGKPSAYSIMSLVFVIVSFAASATAAFFFARSYCSELFYDDSLTVFVNYLLLGSCLIIAVICIALGIAFSFKSVSNNNASQLSVKIALNSRLAALLFLITPGKALLILFSLMLPAIIMTAMSS